MSSKGSARDAVLKYLQIQNRPYSANDITQNLHKEFGKTAIQKALDELSVDKKIQEKVYGKQKVYAALQDEEPSTNMESELLELDSKIEEVGRKLKIVEQEIKTNESVLKDLQNQPTTEEAEKNKNKLETEVNHLEEKLKTLSNTTVKMSQTERDKIMKENERCVKEYRKRKRICLDIANSILENYTKPKKAFFEEVGIETDEEVGFKLINL